MNITTSELKTMKAKVLRRIIREAIQEVLKETTVFTTVDYKNKNTPDKVLDIDPLDTVTINKLKQDFNVGSVSAGGKKIKESDIDEMARTAKGYRVANPNIDTTPFTKTYSGVSLAQIIEFFKENPGAEKSAVQTHFNFVRAQIANAIVKALLDTGILVQLGAGGEPEQGRVTPTRATDAEDMVIGNAENILSMYFDGEPNDGGEEDFNDEEEPTVDDLEKEKVPIGSMSDEDYEAFMRYDDLKQRLLATKSNILKLKRSKNAPGDIQDNSTGELTSLRNLKKSLEDKMDALVSKSDYLKKRTGQLVEPEVEPIIEPEETEEEPLDEWTIGKWQHYAGIKK